MTCDRGMRPFSEKQRKISVFETDGWWGVGVGSRG